MKHHVKTKHPSNMLCIKIAMPMFDEPMVFTIEKDDTPTDELVAELHRILYVQLAKVAEHRDIMTLTHREVYEMCADYSDDVSEIART